MFVYNPDSVPVYQLLKTLSRRPVRSVSSWVKPWDPPCWSERRRQRSGGMRMRGMQAEANMQHPFLTFHVCLQSLPHHGCLCPSSSETEAGRNSKGISHGLMKTKSSLSHFKVFYCGVAMAELKCRFQALF